MSCDGCVAGFGAVNARANGTTDQCTRATKNDARAETANMELTDPCHPRTWKCQTPVTRELVIFLGKNKHDFSVARSGSSWLFCGFSELLSGSEWLFGKSPERH